MFLNKVQWALGERALERGVQEGLTDEVAWVQEGWGRPLTGTHTVGTSKAAEPLGPQPQIQAFGGARESGSWCGLAWLGQPSVRAGLPGCEENR